MLKKIALCVAFVAGTAVLATSAIGCDNTNDTAQDMGGQDQGDNQDAGFMCVMNPMTNDDFLNSCHSAAVAQEDIVPFYPTLAPNGQLPALQ
jgi:hypothetical protein